LKNLREPSLLTDMGKAVARLVEAREKQEAVVVYADYDLDGTSGLALLLKAFDWMGFEKVSFYQPKRLTEGYGLHCEAIQRLHDCGNKLLVTVDLGITAIEETRYARDLGMDVIITDHHLPKETLPEAFAVVNPNRGNCASGLGHLCGTGVAFYLVLALRRALLERGLLHEAFDPKLLLDCFTIGTITDMVPLLDENRVLVKHGLLQLAQTRRPGLRVLLQALGLWGRPLTSQDVAIRFAPKLNALSRMEMGVQPIDLYLVEDETEAHRLVDVVLSNNQTRQASQKSAEAEAVDYLRRHPPHYSIFVSSRNFHRGVVGLVATKLSQEFGLPAFVGSVGEDGKIVGSARMPEGRGLNALDAMGFSHSALEQFGGHAAAAGFELREENVPLFRDKLNQFFSSLAVQSEPRVWMYDAEASLSELDSEFMAWHEHLAPFGVQFAPPVFLLSGVKISQVRSLKGGHFRLTLGDPTSPGVVALWFSPPQEHPAVELMAAGKADQLVDLLVEPQWNYFGGKKTVQLLVQDLRLSMS
jgi:single-stranded-DNA-specific exonuclease